MQLKSFSRLPPLFYLIGIPALLFIPFLGHVHLFDWDEINFAEISREMLVSGNFTEPQINFRPFTEKPPLFFWLQAFSMKFFGVNEFAARFPNALLGILSSIILFAIGKKIKDRSFGFLWALVYAGTLLPHLYFKSGIIDPWFNIFIFLSLYGLVTAIGRKKENKPVTSWLISGGIFLGLAILTKGPAALLVTGITFLVYWITKKFHWFISFSQLIIFGLSALLTTGLWLGINYLQRGDAFITEFTIRQWELLTTPDAGHGGFFFYHFIVLFFGCFPATVFFIQGLLKKEESEKENKFILFKKWMAILFWVVLILFTLVKTKIVHYSSLCYYPLSFIAAASCHHLIQHTYRITRWMKAILVVSALPFVLAPFAISWLSQHSTILKSLAKKDLFAQENLQAAVRWSGWEFIPGLLLLLVLIWSFICFNKKKNKAAIFSLFAGAIVYAQLALFFFIGRIEGYSQHASVEFWKSHDAEDCYMMSYGYKTYVFYFYGKAKLQENKNHVYNDWLLRGKTDKPVYISCQVKKREQFEKEIPDAKFMYKKNGFYFYKREASLK